MSRANKSIMIIKCGPLSEVTPQWVLMRWLGLRPGSIPGSVSL